MAQDERTVKTTSVRVLAVGALITDADGRILLVLRRNDPHAGFWSLPGGKVDTGEAVEDAVAREVAEETGLTVDVGDPVWVVDIPYRPGSDRREKGPGAPDVVFEVHDHWATVRAGRLRAGDDAADVAWFHPSDLRSARITPKVLELLTLAGVLQAGDGSR